MSNLAKLCLSTSEEKINFVKFVHSPKQEYLTAKTLKVHYRHYENMKYSLNRQLFRYYENAPNPNFTKFNDEFIFYAVAGGGR